MTYGLSSQRYTWYVIGLLSVVNVFSYVDRMALAVLMPAIKAELHLSDGQLGLLTGLAFSLFYAVCGIPIARWADRGVRRNIIALALTAWSVMTALSGAAQNFWHLLAARVGIGAGEAGCLPPAQSIICDYVPVERRAGAFAIHSFGNYAGIMLSMVLAGWLGEVVGWRWAFVALGVPGIALAIVVRLTLREPIRGALDGIAIKEPELSLAATVQVLWRQPIYRILMGYLVLNGFVQYGLGQWWPSFFARAFNLSSSELGISLGLAIGAGSAIGLLIGGMLANRTGGRDLKMPLFVGAVAIGLAIPTATGSLFLPDVVGAIILVGSTALFWGVPTGAVIAAVYTVVPVSMRATAGAATILATSVLGFGLGPLCVGLLSDALAASVGGQALQFALVIPICLLPFMAGALFAASRAVATSEGPRK